MHLAAGYAHLAWGELSLSRNEFAAMGDYLERIDTWPQSLTNLGIGRFMAAWLADQLNDREGALNILQGTEEMFQRGVAPLKIWNFHMYEELRGALKVWQYCFVLKKFLEGEKLPHVLPPNFTFGIDSVSAVLSRFTAMGVIPRWRFPDDLKKLNQSAT